MLIIIIIILMDKAENYLMDKVLELWVLETVFKFGNTEEVKNAAVFIH